MKVGVNQDKNSEISLNLDILGKNMEKRLLTIKKRLDNKHQRSMRSVELRLSKEQARIAELNSRKQNTTTFHKQIVQQEFDSKRRLFEHKDNHSKEKVSTTFLNKSLVMKRKVSNKDKHFKKISNRNEIVKQKLDEKQTELFKANLKEYEEMIRKEENKKYKIKNIYEQEKFKEVAKKIETFVKTNVAKADTHIQQHYNRILSNQLKIKQINDINIEKKNLKEIEKQTKVKRNERKLEYKKELDFENILKKQEKIENLLKQKEENQAEIIKFKQKLELNRQDIKHNFSEIFAKTKDVRLY